QELEALLERRPADRLRRLAVRVELAERLLAALLELAPLAEEAHAGRLVEVSDEDAVTLLRLVPRLEVEEGAVLAQLGVLLVREPQVLARAEDLEDPP